MTNTDKNQEFSHTDSCQHEHSHCSCHHHEHEHHHHDHEHHHEHEHHHDHESPQKKLITIGAATLTLILAVVIEKKLHLTQWQALLIYLIPYLIAGYDTLKEAIESALHGNLFNENFLMSIATIGALTIGFLPGVESNQFVEAVFVMLFFQVGEFFEGYAEGKSRESISHLMDIRPDSATVERNGEQVTISPEKVQVGEILVIKPGEKIPLDAVIVEGSTSINTVALTGESEPRSATVDDEVISGCVNLSGLIRARVIKSFSESTVSHILELVENAAEQKSKSENFITRFARIYTPIVVFAALALALIPPLAISLAQNEFHFSSSAFSTLFPVWLYRALMFLVVSCPCALVISVPLSFFGGIGGASRRGILIKGARFMDVLAKVDTVVFDKTGTLTKGKFAVTAVHPDQCDENHLLHLAAHVEHFSNHPIGAALRDAFPDADNDGCQVSEVEEIAGHGIRARVGNDLVFVGNSKMMEACGAKWRECHSAGTIIHIAINGIYAGHIVINDQIKADSQSAVAELKTLGVNRTVMLSGDRDAVVKDVAKTLNIDEYHSQLLPGDKIDWMERISGSNKAESDSSTSRDTNPSSCVAFVGDGINDAPVLARADVGIAMGGLGSDAAIEAADIVIMDDTPSKVASAIRIARRPIGIARQNVIFAIGVKVAVLILAAIGLASMWMAVFADVGVTFLAIVNAMRTLKYKK